MAATKSILCIDDHPLVAIVIKHLSRQFPEISAVHAIDGPDSALAEIDRLKPDMVVLEMVYANGAGLSLIKDIHIQFPAVSMIVFSSLEGATYVGHCIRCGARGFVSKREPIEEFGKAIKEVLAGNLYLDPHRMTALLARIGEGGRTAATASVERLSNGEFEVFGLIGQGKSNREIAEILHRSIKTVETYRSRIKDKLALRSSTELVQYAFRFRSSDREVEHAAIARQ